jgi:hypothetical protein
LSLSFLLVAAVAAFNTSMPDVLCEAKEVCVRTPGAKCTVRTGYVKPENRKQDRKCAAPMKCLRDWDKEDEGVCVLASAGMPCLMNNFLGDCSTLQLGPNAYCAEGRCHHPPSFPGDHCWVPEECTSGSTCEANVCRGVPEDGLCTNQFRLCDRGLFCPNEPPGHARCRKQAEVGEACEAQFSLASFFEGLVGVNTCVPGAHCNGRECVANDGVRAKLGDNCTGRIMVGHVERLCEDGLFCHPARHTCQQWPGTLWSACREDEDCGDGLSCNCKVGGIRVCEVPNEEGAALLGFEIAASEGVTKCIAEHKCWRGQSAYPVDIFNSHSCAWINCRKQMALTMHAKFCVPRSLPEYRDCVLQTWCEELRSWTTIEKAPPPAATRPPNELVERLSPGEISMIVIGSLLLTLLVFFSGFIIGWLRNKYRTWRGAGGEDSSSVVEFAKLDSLVTTTVDL